MRRIIAVIVAIGIAALGVGCILRPATIQGYVLRTQSDSWAWRINPFADWMKQPDYRRYLRIMGVFMLLFAAIMIVAAALASD